MIISSLVIRADREPFSSGRNKKKTKKKKNTQPCGNYLFAASSQLEKRKKRKEKKMQLRAECSIATRHDICEGAETDKSNKPLVCGQDLDSTFILLICQEEGNKIKC